jgi:hypothetical protein
MKYYFQNLLNHRRAAILDGYEMCSFLLNRLFYGFWLDATELKMLGYEMENLVITIFLNSAEKSM